MYQPTNRPHRRTNRPHQHTEKYARCRHDGQTCCLLVTGTALQAGHLGGSCAAVAMAGGLLMMLVDAWSRWYLFLLNGFGWFDESNEGV